MGTFYVGCKVENHRDPKRVAAVPKLLVDTGSEYTWIPAEILARIGIEPVKKDLPIQLANGQIITRSVGYAILRVDKYETTDEIVFAQKGDLLLFGSRTMLGMNVQVDPRRKCLAAAGPVVAAVAVGCATEDSVLKEIARKLFWWESPEEALAQPRRFLAQVMTLGTWNEIKQVEAALGLEAFKDALQHAPPGIFDKRSWAYWHAVFSLPEAEMPQRTFPPELQVSPE